MKKIFKTFLFMAALMGSIACNQNKPDDQDENKTDELGNFRYQGSDPDCYEFGFYAAEGDFNAPENGVSIKIDKVQDNNVIFSLLPGKSVASYRVDVYPKSVLYNSLLNDKMIEASADDVEDKIIEYLTAETGAAGYSFSSEDLEDYENHQFDWMNSTYAQYKIVPDCEYFITVLACYDKDAANVASLSISHFKTGSQPVSGDPVIGLDVETGYRAFKVNYVPNDDCKYFYNWVWLSNEIDEYIDTFGETMMRDFMRSAVYTALDVTVEENLYTVMTFDKPDPSISYTALAIALDENQMPVENIVRKDYHLKAAPVDADAPKASIEVNRNRLAATVAWLDVNMEKTAMSCFYNILSKSQAESYMTASEDKQSAYAIALATEGWGVANKNYTFDPESQKPTGSSFYSGSEFVTDLDPENEYVIVYVAKNFFGQLSDLCFSESFTTKALVTDNPDACLCNDDFKFELRNPTREGWTYYAEYNWDEIALYRHQIVGPADILEAEYSPYVDDNNTGSREDWMYFFFKDFSGPYASPKANVWWPLPEGREEFSYFGYTPGIEYVVAYCAEDINGVVGPVKFAKVTTRSINPGPNPSMKVEASISADGSTLNYKFISNEDSKMMKYFTSSEGSYRELGLHKLLPENDKRGEYEYADFMRVWKTYAIEYGLLSTNTQVTGSVEVDPESDDFLLISAVSIGEKDGEDCYSELGVIIYYKGEIHQLSEYRDAPAN